MKMKLLNCRLARGNTSVAISDSYKESGKAILLRAPHPRTTPSINRFGSIRSPD